ncbi:hypothetical protein [Micromonospora coerulea]|uniref:hypothetical protein n=1 Tax=Micromonospora coerulea TaxID=47856 RepID=UPI003556D38C
MPEVEAVTRPDEVGAGGDGSGPVGRWLRADRVRAVAFVLIMVAVAWRAGIATRGWFSQDEFVIAAQASAADLTVDHLLRTFNNHLTPGGLLVAWLMVRVAGFASWPWVLLLAAGQAAVGVAFYRLLRDLLRPGWGLLIPLCMLLFSPLTLEATSLWMVGLLMLPVLLAMVLAVAAQVRYVRTGRSRHLVAVALWVVFGLAFDSKALLIVPLLYVLTACLFATGGPTRSLVSITRRYWPAWLMLAAVSAAYLALYLKRPAGALNGPRSPGEVLTFIGDLVGTTLVPGLLGGPWRWTYAGDGPPLADPYDVTMWLSWAVLLTLVVVTVRWRPSALRAWTLLLSYVAMVAVLFAATRLGNVLSPLAGLVPRYVADVVVVAALCVGVALLGRSDAEEDDVASWPVPTVLREPGAFAVGLIAMIMVLATVGIGTLWSTARFGDNWRTKHGRDYLSTTQFELAAAPPDTVFLDDIVPDRVVAGYFWPDNLQSHFFRPAELKPRFVTDAESPSMFDDTGRIRPAAVQGRRNVPGPDETCGHRIDGGRTARILLDGPVPEWPWVVYFGYLSSGDSTVTFRLGEASHQFAVRRGLNQIFFRLEGGGPAVEVTAADPSVVICTKVITVGDLVPAR